MREFFPRHLKVPLIDQLDRSRSLFCTLCCLVLQDAWLRLWGSRSRQPRECPNLQYATLIDKQVYLKGYVLVEKDHAEKPTSTDGSGVLSTAAVIEWKVKWYEFDAVLLDFVHFTDIAAVH